MSRPAWQFIVGLLGGLLAALAAGWIAGRPALFVAAYLALVVALQAWNLIRFERWLRLRSILKPPNMRGLWGETVERANRLYQRKRFHKRRALALLRELRRMTSAMPDGAILLGPTREILWFNPTAAQWLGLRRKLDYGIRIDNLIRQPEFVEYVVNGGKGPGPRVHMPNLGDRWFAFNLVTTSARDLQLLIVRDVTSEARLEGMRRDFVANASHELRSPLTVVRGYLDTLAEDPALDETWREPVREMQRQSDRMHSIVSDLLELSRLEAGRGEAELEPIDVAGLLSLMRKEVLSRPDRPARFDAHLESNALLLGAESELHSIFQNLITNAVKYTPPEGTVSVRYWTDARGGHVAVSDTGIGIPAAHIPRLTERFYRVDSGRSRKLGGSGLGLAIVKHALQRHGAQLEITSEEGKGSTFTCHFPPARVQHRPAQ
ncbi:MAG: phosphate regulon sensor histidine kinase PhoR [Gammaproteobacteria bacterium]|nr:phosphate regulon sensor histidine kinase PhoR [Gammaproteobacteria bacterium]MDH4312728.1 phosphate regulon sensor histidine kinase PhoR [Gammaproteobacteria bacterium]MDH5274724.1 phosphate regulon sensor histidine kinase PhoR [Gammaproteobacteria bacterium]